MHIVLVAAIVVAVAAAASESSSLTEALGPKLDPVDTAAFWASPLGGLGPSFWVSPPRAPSGPGVAALVWLARLGSALPFWVSPPVPDLPSGSRVPSPVRLARLGMAVPLGVSSEVATGSVPPAVVRLAGLPPG